MSINVLAVLIGYNIYTVYLLLVAFIKTFPTGIGNLYIYFLFSAKVQTIIKVNTLRAQILDTLYYYYTKRVHLGQVYVGA